MKKIFLAVLNFSITLSVYSQTTQQYYLYSNLFLDSLGNQYQTKKSYSHIPTYEDSLLFYKESKMEIFKMMDSFFADQKKYQSSLKKKNSKKKLKN